MGQQFYFFIDPIGITCQIPASPDDTMAKNSDGNSTVPHCAAYRLRGHPFPIVEYGYFLSQFPIGYGFTTRNLAGGFPCYLPGFISCRLKPQL